MVDRLDAGCLGRLVVAGAGLVPVYEAVAHADHPAEGWVVLGPARAAPYMTVADHQDAVAEIVKLVALRLEHVPQVMGLLHIGPDALVTYVSPGLDAGAGQREQLDLRVIELEQPVDVPSGDGREAAPHELDVAALRHQRESRDNEPGLRPFGVA